MSLCYLDMVRGGTSLSKMKSDMHLLYRLTTIDESASLLSDISFDQTDDSLVC